MAIVRIKLGSLDINELNGVCGTIKEIAKKSNRISSDFILEGSSGLDEYVGNLNFSEKPHQQNLLSKKPAKLPSLSLN